MFFLLSNLQVESREILFPFLLFDPDPDPVPGTELEVELEVESVGVVVGVTETARPQTAWEDVWGLTGVGTVPNEGKLFTPI